GRPCGFWTGPRSWRRCSRASSGASAVPDRVSQEEAGEGTMPTTVLVVDDAVFMRNMIKDIFSNTDFEVIGEAANGVEAVEKFRELQPDLTTMDIVMPLKSGIEAVRDITAFKKDARIVMCSALGQEALV